MNNKIKYDNNKVSIIGCGKVGTTAAYAMLITGVANEIVMFGRCSDKIIGDQLDLEHGLPFVQSLKITATENFEDISNSDVVIISAGIPQKPGDTRLDLTKKNVEVVESIIPQVVRYAPNAVIVVVSNPVDILTYKSYLKAGFPKGRVFGTGTTLDSARFQFHLSEIFKVSPKSIHAYILGEHGDSSFPAISGANIGGQPLTTFPGFSVDKIHKAYLDAKNAAYKIIHSKGATFYAIGIVISHIVNSILRDTKEILPLSVPLHDYYGHNGVALSVPCVLGRNGVEKQLEIPLSSQEKKQLDESVEILKSYM